MKVELIQEPVKVRADFSGGVISPLAFKRNHETYRIERVNCHWRDKQGQEISHYFSVLAAGDVYELRLRLSDMTWWIERVMLDD